MPKEQDHWQIYFIFLKDTVCRWLITKKLFNLQKLWTLEILLECCCVVRKLSQSGVKKTLIKLHAKFLTVSKKLCLLIRQAYEQNSLAWLWQNPLVLGYGTKLSLHTGVIKNLILWSLHHNLEKSYADWFSGKLVKTFYTGTYSHRFNSFDEFLAF